MNCQRLPLQRGPLQIQIPAVESNPGDLAALWYQFDNLSGAYRGSKLRISVTYRMSGDPTVGAPFVYPVRHPIAVGGSSYVPQTSAPLQLATLARTKIEFVAGRRTTGSVDVDGIDGFFVSNTMDFAMTAVTIEVEVIATPTNEVGS